MWITFFVGLCPTPQQRTSPLQSLYFDEERVLGEEVFSRRNELMGREEENRIFGAT